MKILILAFFLSISQLGFASPVKAQILHEHETMEPGKPFPIAIHLELDKGWHAYWKNPGVAGMAPTINWELPAGYAIDHLNWPTPKMFDANGAIGFGYEDELILLTSITPPQEAEGIVPIKATIQWVVCDDSTCLPGNAEVTTTIKVSPNPTNLHAAHKSHFHKGRNDLPQKLSSVQFTRDNNLIALKINRPVTTAQFYPEDSERIDTSKEAIITKDGKILLSEVTPSVAPLKGVLLINNKDAYEINAELEKNQSFLMILSLAFLGGLILNAMPCVLPVISFKVLSFIKMAGQSRSLIFKHGLAFSIGVLISFWVLAGAILMLQAWGQTVGWGFQLQEPLFVAILAAVIFVFALSLFGLFELGVGIAGAAGQASMQKQGSALTGSFFSGILATAVATPCTGPFLGTAVGIAVTLPWVYSMLVFTSLGLGMASPYLLLGAFPSLLRFMPKPGNWMVTFKEIMGFLMLATVLWLVWVFGAQTDALALFLLLAGFFLLAFGSWIFGKWGSPIKKKQTRLISVVFTTVFFALGSYIIYQASTLTAQSCIDESEIAMADIKPQKEEWVKFNPEKVEILQKRGIPVFIDFTAKWCLICQTNHLVLTLDQVSQKFEEKGVVRMKADWTKNDPIITEALRKYGRNGVPLYVLLDGDKEPVILPQVLSSEAIIQALDKI